MEAPEAAAFRLDGKKALVIGAGTDVGRAVALALAEAGADLALASATTDGNEVMAVRRTRRGVEALGRRAAEYAFDVTLGQNVQVSTRQAAKELGGLDVLVNAQDFFLGQPLERTSDADWSRVLSLNLSGVFFACRAAAREMRSGGRVLNIVSTLGRRGMSNTTAYTAAKHGVIGVSRSMALEFAERGLRVNVIEFGWMAGGPVSGPDSPENLLVRYVPMKRLGRPDEIGPLAVYLASDAADFVTGQVFSVSGGVTAHL